MEYKVPPPFNAVLMVALVSWWVALCLLMNLLWVLHSPAAMWMHEFGNPQSGHASVGASVYTYANLP